MITYRLGENICKGCDGQGLNFQNIQTAHTTQSKKTHTNKSRSRQKNCATELFNIS